MSAKLTIEYDGGAFRGWAKQPGQRTVQEELERALQTVRREPTPLTVAGRTDAGVHAWGQVASHSGEPADARSLNALLPDDIAVLASESAPEGFDARMQPTARSYCYRIWNHPQRSALLRGRVWWVRRPLECGLLEAAAERLLGEHDFEAFTLSQQPYEHYRRRILEARWGERDGVLEFWITGDTFTRRMVRSLTAWQVELAEGRHELADLDRLLAGAPRSSGGGTAPPDGLHLARVSFGPTDEASA